LNGKGLLPTCATWLVCPRSSNDVLNSRAVSP